MARMDARHFSTSEVADLTGASYRQLDYWSRNGVLVPEFEATGSGSRRSYSAADVERARVVRAVSELGAPGPVLTRIVAELADHDLREWPLLLFVLVDGTVSHSIVPGVGCYCVDVGGLCAAGRGRHRVSASA